MAISQKLGEQIYPLASRPLIMVVCLLLRCLVSAITGEMGISQQASWACGAPRSMKIMVSEPVSL
jgi:hypothetical protein